MFRGFEVAVINPRRGFINVCVLIIWNDSKPSLPGLSLAGRSFCSAPMPQPHWAMPLPSALEKLNFLALVLLEKELRECAKNCANSEKKAKHQRMKSATPSNTASISLHVTRKRRHGEIGILKKMKIWQGKRGDAR